VKGRGGAGPARLQEKHDAMASPNSRSTTFVLRGERLENPQHQDVRGISPSPTASSICGTRSRMLRLPISSRSAGSRSEILRGSTSHDSHVGDVARLLLVEADQHAALFRDVPHRQTSPVAVVP
jgi:hypothetical protein